MKGADDVVGMRAIDLPPVAEFLGERGDREAGGLGVATASSHRTFARPVLSLERVGSLAVRFSPCGVVSRNDERQLDFESGLHDTAGNREWFVPPFFCGLLCDEMEDRRPVKC